MRLVFATLAALWLAGCCITASAQSKILPVGAFLNPLEYIRGQLPVEKLYIHTDKPNYTSGDTIWFKAYLLNADYLNASQRSGLLYIELDDITNKSAKRIMTPLADGLSWGSIALNPQEIPEGTYTLRAYTNWMLNFGEDFIYRRQLTISSVNNQPRLISTRITKTSQGAKDSIRANLLFTDINKEPVRLQDMQYRVADGKRTLYHGKGATSIEGILNINFALPDRDKNAYIIARQTIKKEGDDATDLIIPINANRPENTDLQFMPEGGNLVAGIPSHTAFKAIGEDGKSTAIEGNIRNSKQALVAAFKSTHNGMGAFDFIPQPGEVYTAEVALPDGAKKIYRLPAVAPSGTALKVTPQGPDSVTVTISATADLVAKGGSYYLLAQAHDAVCYGALIMFNQAVVKRTIARSVFPTGITRFTLLTAARQPLNERMIYIDHHDQLQLSITPNLNTYTTRDSVSLGIQVTDQTGKPVQGAFSLAVTDDAQVKQDSLSSNMITQLLLTSDLKGDIEDPAYYLKTGPAVLNALDLLLLTQGWVGYSWKQVYSNNIQPAFAAQPYFTVQGKVTNIFNKPVAKSGVLLLSKNPQMVLDTVTGDDGRFVFKGFYPVDSASFMIQARNKRGKSFNVDVQVDEMQPPVFSQTATVPTPWYVNTDTTAMRRLNHAEAKRIADEKGLFAGTVLKNVTITSKKLVKNSKNLNGTGEADQVLDDKDMEKAGKMTLYDLLEKSVKGYHESGFWRPTPFARKAFDVNYMINDKWIKFVFDGIEVAKYFRGSMQDYKYFIKSYLDYYTAEDILGLEVMTSGKFSGPYGMEYLPPMSYVSAYAFVEVTTRSGHGPYMRKTPGTYVYKPLPFSLPKQFYRPRYAVKSKPTGADARSTIHWEPNIITDATGCATVSFYTADRAGKYTILLQGADLYGALGYLKSTIEVTK